MAEETIKVVLTTKNSARNSLSLAEWLRRDPNIGGIKDGPDPRAGDRVPPVVGIEDRGPEPTLAQTDAREALAGHRAVMPPRRIALTKAGSPALELRGQDVEVPSVALWVPRTSSTSCDQAVFVDHAADARVSSDTVLLKIDRFG